jgi:hypothetical protein
MNEADFWHLISNIDTDALRDGDEDAAIEPLNAALQELDAAALTGFQELLAQSLYKLDGKIYADNAGESGTSGDGFLYCRCFVVGLGRDVFNATLADPALMPKTLDEWFEPLLSCAEEAFCEVSDDDSGIETSVSFETGSNESQW